MTPTTQPSLYRADVIGGPNGLAKAKAKNSRKAVRLLSSLFLSSYPFCVSPVLYIINLEASGAVPLTEVLMGSLAAIPFL